MAKNDNVEFGKFRKNIMGTLSFEMKLPSMRKMQDFIVYPVNEKTNYITIQSDTRFGKIEMTTGRGLMSQSHANGAYAVHLHIDKLVKFELTESQLEKLKEELAKTAGRNVGSAGVVSDNEYADKFAKGGGFDQYGNPMGFERDYDTEYEIHHKPEMNSKTPYMIWDKMDGVYVGAYQSRQRAIEWIESNSYYAKGGQTDSLYKIQQKYKYDLQPKWEDEKFQTGGRHFLTYKQAQEVKKKLQGLSSSMEYKVVKVEEKFAAGGKLGYKERAEKYSIKLAKAYQKLIDKNFDDPEYLKYKKLIEESQIPKEELMKIETYVATTPKGQQRPIDIYRYWGAKYAAGGELVDKTIDHSGRYLDIVGNHRMLHIHLNDEGREMVMEERENGRDDEEIMYELFEDVAGNSDLMYHTDLGESGFGMTDASGVTAGYMYGDDGELEPADDTAVVYVDNDSYRRSPVDEMLHTHLVLKNSDFMAKGGMTFGGKMAGAGIFADGGLADDNVALFDSLKKGDTIKITFKDSISGSDEATLKVKSKTVVNKGKATESEKINFINTENPHGVGWYAYKRKNGFVGFAWGDMAIWDVRVIDRYADGGNTDKPKRDFYEERTTNPYYSKAYNTEVINRVQVIYSSEYDQAIISNTISKADNGYVYRSEKVPITGEGISALYSILGKVMHGMFHGGNFAKGGTVDTYLPVGKEVSGREINNFIEYVEKFYGKNGLYAEDLGGGFTKKRIKEAVNKYLADLSKGETWGHGDSLDRERVRQYLQPEYSLLAKGGHMGKKTIEKVTLIFDGKEHKYDMVFIDGEFEEVLLPYSMDTPLFDYLEKEFDDWMDSASRDYHDMYFSDEAIYTRSGAIKGAIEVIDDTISEDRGKKKVYNLDKGEVDTMSAYS